MAKQKKVVVQSTRVGPAHVIVQVSKTRYRIGYCCSSLGDTPQVTLIGPKFKSELAARSAIASAAQAWYGLRTSTSALTWLDVARAVGHIGKLEVRDSFLMQKAMNDIVDYWRTRERG
jgi:hypothetical protein